jgi:Glycosyltransferase family 92
LLDVNAGAWKGFIDYASFARRKPAFDLEERVPRLETARHTNDVLDAVRAGGPWADPLKDAFRVSYRRMGGPFDLVNGNHVRWLRGWCDSDPGSLRDCIAVFVDAADSPAERVARFDAAVRRTAAGADAPGGAVMWVASVFNFALDPAHLLMVRPAPFSHLRKILELDPVAAGPADRQYRELHDFAREIGAALEQHDVPVRDMLDVQSLIDLASRHHAWWAQRDEAAVAARRGTPDHYLSVCAVYRDEAPYLREWIEFHRLVGVERFYLYDNGSTDEHLDVLEPYLREGSVTVHDWPGESTQLPAYADCVARYGDESRWIAFIDLDEFLFSPTGRPLPELLPRYEGEAGVVVNVAIFGPCGHSTRPSGLVTESYQMQLESHRTRLVKTIADPLAVERPAGPHHFEYAWGLAVDENGHPVRGNWTKSVSYSALRINHYVTKSEEELRAKLTLPRADNAPEPRDYLHRLLAAGKEPAQNFPESSIAIYLPALREAVAKVGAR